MASPLAVLLLGFLLGIRHAFDPDHLVAVTTIVRDYRNPLRAIWVGVSWGLGHTTTLFIAGTVLLLIRVPMPPELARFFELAVGVMLVFLGFQTFWSFRRKRVHVHPHGGGDETHVHFHSHARSAGHSHHQSSSNNTARLVVSGMVPGEHLNEGLRGTLKPFIRLKSYVVGTVHGLAGSATLLLLVLANLESHWLGIWYILLFGLGSIGAMGIITIFLALPFSVTARLPRLNQLVQSGAASFSILFGFFLLYEVGAGLFG